MLSHPLCFCYKARLHCFALLSLVIAPAVGCGPGGSTSTHGQSANNESTGSAGSTTQLTSAADTSPAQKEGGGKSERAERPPRPLVDGWEKPAAAIVLSGEQHGYFEPCGCTELQLGGMSRRDDLFRQLREKGWSVTGVDLGGSTLREGRQSLLKFETMLDSLRQMQYRALAIGPEEIRLGLDNLLQMHVFDANDPDSSLSLLAANVVFYDAPDLGTPRPWRIINVDGVKIGVTAILGSDFNGSGLLSKNNADIKIKDPAEALPGVIAELKKQSPDIMLLLSHTSPEQSRELASQFTDFDVILTAGGPEDPDGVPAKVGKSLLLSVGRKGKHVGVLGYYPKAKERFRFELVELGRDRFQDSPKIVEFMRTYQRRLQEEKLAGNHPDNPAIDHPSGATFVGADKCGECHTKAFEIWKNTPHFHGFEGLEKRRRAGEPDYGITRAFDAECLSCHVTGWNPQRVFRYNSGFINEEFAEGDEQRQMSQLLKGVQCENCHGPGSKHVELVGNEELEEARKQMRVTLETAQKELCFNCHDSDNSPNFNFDVYWPQIEHKGLD